ncbi:MAG: phosphoribosylamine--glycine ligase [Gemmatimonadota bacterium]|nr:MAG: phosphoribosylamine--glycine ligase [Gemmatimonadota bacterium]
MRILIIGNGGREHTLLWKLAKDRPDAEFFATQPNGGMAPLCKGVEIAPGDLEALTGWAAARQIDLAVVGPEAPLAAGIVDRLRSKGVPAFGPTQAAARIESSKAYAKNLMTQAGVRTAAYSIFEELAPAQDYIREMGAPVVVKASGLAAGKGALVCETVEDALEGARMMMEDRTFGEAGRQIVVEEFMTGEELSVFALTDGSEALVLLPSQDHKRIGEGDTGPNTGGMGAYAPVGLATPELIEEVTSTILRPTLAALAEDGAEFRGLLYAGLMLTQDGPSVVEFNCRFGDPETQVVLPLLDSSLLDLLVEVAEGGSLAGRQLRWSKACALTTVMASEGYPGRYPKGLPITIPDDLRDDPSVLILHAGTRQTEEGLVTSGGRVLAVTGLGDSMAKAGERSRAAAARIDFDGKRSRTDIGWRELARSSLAPDAGHTPSA